MVYCSKTKRNNQFLNEYFESQSYINQICPILTKQLEYRSLHDCIYESVTLLFLKVIGDKKGGETAIALQDSRKMNVLEEIHQVVQVPMKFIHVTRNPFDNISTMMLRTTGSHKKVREEGVKVSWVLIKGLFHG